jgi:hypothetical protein
MNLNHGFEACDSHMAFWDAPVAQFHQAQHVDFAYALDGSVDKGAATNRDQRLHASVRGAAGSDSTPLKARAFMLSTRVFIVLQLLYSALQACRRNALVPVAIGCCRRRIRPHVGQFITKALEVVWLKHFPVKPTTSHH